MEEQNKEVVEVGAEQAAEINRFIRRARFTCGYMWRAIEEAQAEMAAENIALPEYIEMLIEDVSTRADALAEEAKQLFARLG